MQALSDNEVIGVWERGALRSPLDRALLLLAVASPETPTDALADMAIDERDARVLELRTALFGEHFTGIAECPQCAQTLEFQLCGAALRRHRLSQQTEDFVTAGGLRFRLPNSRDLAAVFADEAFPDDDESAKAQKLLRGCCLNATAETAWNTAVYEEAEAGLDALGAKAGLQLQFQCESCRAQWETPLDICAWLWAEIDRRGRTLLDEVHVLASTYGWDEQRILAMSPARRSAYLQRCQS